MLFFLCLIALSYASHTLYGSDESESNTTLTTMQTKLSFELHAHNSSYIIQWTTEVHAEEESSSVKINLRLDETMVYNEQDHHYGGWVVASGFFVVTLDDTNHTFYIEYSSGTLNKIVSIRRARILVSEINL